MSTLAAPDALTLLLSTAEPRAQLLDVREPWEVAHASVRLDGVDTLWVPLGQLAERWTELDATRPVVCLCHHGVRSQHAALFLAHHGLHAINLGGGIDAWSVLVDPSVPRY